MACGIPVVTTRVGGNAEIVVNERLGTLVPASDDAALVDAILNALVRDWDRDALVAHARAHSWATAAAQVVDEFRAALSTEASAPLTVASQALAAPPRHD